MSLAALAIVALVGCSDSTVASVDQPAPDKNGTTSDDTKARVADNNGNDGQTGEVFYVGTGRLGLYPERKSVRPMTFLSLDEKVVRLAVEDGWARVRVERTGQTGWVNDAQLIQRHP